MCVFCSTNGVKCNEKRFQMSFFNATNIRFRTRFVFYILDSIPFRCDQLFTRPFLANWLGRRLKFGNGRCFKPLTNFGYGKPNTIVIGQLQWPVKVERANIHITQSNRNDVRSEMWSLFLRFVFVPKVIDQIYLFHLLFTHCTKLFQSTEPFCITN